MPSREAPLYGDIGRGKDLASGCELDRLHGLLLVS